MHWHADTIGCASPITEALSLSVCLHQESTTTAIAPPSSESSASIHVSRPASPTHGSTGKKIIAPHQEPRLHSILTRCRATRDLSEAKQFHAYLKRHGYDRNTLIGNSVVQMYGNCGSVRDAHAALEQIDVLDGYSWNLLLKACTQNGNLDEANAFFIEMPQRDVVSWTVIIAAHVHSGKGHQALDLFYRMRYEGIKPNEVTYLSVLEGCSDLREGDHIHATVVGNGYEQDVCVSTALVNMYGNCKSVERASIVFNRINEQDVVSCNAVIKVYSKNGEAAKALQLFGQMQVLGMTPDRITFIALLDACATLAFLEMGQNVHGYICIFQHDKDIVLGNALINMYGKCGGLQDCWHVFNSIALKDVVTWSAMIATCTENGIGKDALALYHQMKTSGVMPDKVSFMCALDACASLAALEEGESIHVTIVLAGIEQDAMIGSAILNMYGKCGGLDATWRAFHRRFQWDVFSWSAMIAACAQNGLGQVALDLFCRMQDEGIEPSEITFTCILSACSHSGQVEKARNYFVSMSKDHGIAHSLEHFMCMIDMLCRAGHLEEAEDLINSMPSKDSALGWASLLLACKVHGDLERGLRASKNLL